MIKVGFVVEDKAFEAVINSDDFIRILKKNSIELVDVLNANGRDGLRIYNKRIGDFFKKLNDKRIEFVFVLIDKEDDPCITFAKNNVYVFNKEKQINIIAVKAIESWFLADSETLSKLFNTDFKYSDPEKIEDKAFDVLRKEFFKYTKKGLGKRRNLHAKYLIKSGFSIQNAAKHPNCPSAKYFLEKLSQLNPYL